MDLGFFVTLLVVGIVGGCLLALLDSTGLWRVGQPGYVVLVVLVALALVVGVVGAVVRADDGPKGACRQRGGVPTQVGRGWFCAAPGTVR